MHAEIDGYKKFAEEFFLWINQHPEFSKISFSLGDPAFHLTLRIWKDKREIDLHRTNQNLDRNDPKYHETLFRINFFAVGRILVTLKNIDFEKLVRILLSEKITVGKLNKHRCLLIPLNSEDQVIQDFSFEKKKRSGVKYKLNPEFDFNLLPNHVTPEDGLIHSSESFMVLRFKKGVWVRNGFVYRFSANPNFCGKRSYVYFSPKNFRAFVSSANFLIYNMAKNIDFTNKEKVLTMLKEKVPAAWIIKANQEF